MALAREGDMSSNDTTFALESVLMNGGSFAELVNAATLIASLVQVEETKEEQVTSTKTIAG